MAKFYLNLFLHFVMLTNMVRSQQVDVFEPLGNPFVGFGNNRTILSTSRITNIDWRSIDRRAEEGWWHLYPFGERFYDVDLSMKSCDEKKVYLDFLFPFSGFLFNQTFILPDGCIAFHDPQYVQLPYSFPQKRWPEVPDPSLIAAFMMDQKIAMVGDTRIGHLWYRVISRPHNLIGKKPERSFRFGSPDHFQFAGSSSSRYYHGQLLKTQNGRLEDPELLDQISKDIHGIVGAKDFTADYALLVTWERMAYGGAPIITQLDQYEQAKRWQNTYQLLIATDEAHSYAMFNYGNINWTTSTAFGGFSGRGGSQWAKIGFNSGSGSGFHNLPYSGKSNSYNLVRFGSTTTAGRWLARVDEEIVYGGCVNSSTGILKTHTKYGSMLGGFSLNISGPCFRPESIIKLQIIELTLDCERINMVVAHCKIPVNPIFHNGVVDVKLSVDGGKTYPFWNKLYLVPPNNGLEKVNLINDPVMQQNNWRNPLAENLTLSWSATNITTNVNSQIDITLWGYWENEVKHELVEIGSIARGIPNRGVYSFNPRMLSKADAITDGWKRFRGGMVQVRATNEWMERSEGVYWSEPIPFGWYFRDVWEYEYGKDWASSMCQDWFELEGKKENFTDQLESQLSCPCTLDQALADFGRFTAKPDCDRLGDFGCYHTRGASHCVISVQNVWPGSGQQCCYDNGGWLMFSQDYEYSEQYLRFSSAGVPFRAHPWGVEPYKRPPHIPTLSNFYNDLLPYEYCCKWGNQCEYFYKRRPTSSCKDYKPPRIGFAYGGTHFITYDGIQYTFDGKGYFVLSKIESPKQSLMVQVRMEQPPKTPWDQKVPGTVITGLASKVDDSSTVQVFARKERTRWRYKMDIFVDGRQYFFDKPFQKLQSFDGVTIRSPARNMNTSEIEILFSTGVGIRVTEKHGLLNIAVSLPPSYNETKRNATSGDKCSDYYHTLGLLGTFNNNPDDDLLTTDCSNLVTSNPLTPEDIRQIYDEFGEKWRVDGGQNELLFQSEHKPLYDPISFASPSYTPQFDPWRSTDVSFQQSLYFSRDEVKVVCQGIRSCEFDYLLTGQRELALGTLNSEQSYLKLKKSAEQSVVSCGPLFKNKGVIKHSIGNNYMDGVTINFACKLDYELIGTQQRTCVNGTWTSGELAQCKSKSTARIERTLEEPLPLVNSYNPSFVQGASTDDMLEKFLNFMKSLF